MRPPNFCLILVTLILATNLCFSAHEIEDPFFLSFGPKNGDTFNTRERTCSEKPIPLGFEFKYGDETFAYAFVCKGGFIALSNDKDSVEPLTTNLISAFWTEDVNSNHWVSPFVDQLCLEILKYRGNEKADVNYPENPLWSEQNITFPNYFSPEDVLYDDMCSGEGQGSADLLEEMIKSESVRTMRWVNKVYDLPTPSARTSRELTLTGNIFKRVDTSKHTLDILTSFLRKVTQLQTFEADWSFVVTWFRTPLTRGWDGWLSHQTCLVCGRDKSGGGETSSDCYVIWFYEAAATAPCDGCQELPLPLETGFYVNGTFSSFPSSLEGKENVTKLLSSSNIGVPGAYVFHLKDGIPTEPDYPPVNMYPCPREISPNECDLYSDKNIFTMYSFFCDSPIPSGDQVEIVFEGAYTSKTVRPERVDQSSGEIEAYFPFWGVIEPVAVYLLIDGKIKDRSLVQVNFVSLHERLGFWPFSVFSSWESKLSSTEVADYIPRGWPDDYPFQSDNLFIRSVGVKGAHAGEEFTSDDVDFQKQETYNGMMLRVNNSHGLSYKAILAPTLFNEFLKKDTIAVKVPIVMINAEVPEQMFDVCEKWIAAQEHIDVSHCLDRFQGPYCSGGLCVDYSCPLNASHLVYGDVTTLDKQSWHEDPTCSRKQDNSFEFVYNDYRCVSTNGAAYCLESLSFPCRDGKDPSIIHQISNKCCYTTDDLLITDQYYGAGGILLNPGVKHDYASFVKHEWEPSLACCWIPGTPGYMRTNGENSCDAFHRLRPFVQSPA